MIASALAIAACTQPYFGDAVPYPAGCSQIELDATRCAALVLEARTRLGLSEQDVVSVDLLVQGRCEADRSVLCKTGGGGFHSVRFTRTDASFAWINVGCGFNEDPSPWC